MESTCPFCHKKIAETAFAESTNFYVIYNKSPILPGHSLLICKQHYTSLLELNAALRSELMELSIKAVRMLQHVFQADAFNWTLQDGKAAGQTVMHLHLHLIPRFSGDLPDPGDWYPLLEQQDSATHIDSSKRVQYSHEQLKTIAKRIRNYGM